MIFNEIKYKWQSNNIEIIEINLSSIAEYSSYVIFEF